METIFKAKYIPLLEKALPEQEDFEHFPDLMIIIFLRRDKKMIEDDIKRIESLTEIPHHEQENLKDAKYQLKCIIGTLEYYGGLEDTSGCNSEEHF